MLPDDLKAALDALASEVPGPERGCTDVVGRGRRRRLQRRVALVGVAAVLIAAVAVVATIVGTGGDKHAVTSLPSTSTPTTPQITAPPGVAGPVTSSVFPSALEAWKCGNPMQYTSNGGQSWQRVALPAVVPAGGAQCTAIPGGNAWATWPNADDSAWHMLRIRGLNDMRVFTLPKIPKTDTFDWPTFIDRDHGWFTVRNDTAATHAVPNRRWRRDVDTRVNDAAARSEGIRDPRRGWAVFGPGLVATTDGGDSWKKIALPVPAGKVVRFQLAARGNSLVVWSGTHITGSQYKTFFDVSDDGGLTWALRSGPAGFELPTGADNYFSATDASHWQIVSGPELRVTADAGQSWQVRPDLPLPKNGNLLFPLSFPTANIGWATTQDGKILRTADGGRTWADVTNGGAPATPPPAPRPPYPLAFAGPGEGWICGETVTYTTHVFDEYSSGTNGVTIPPAVTTPAGEATQPALCAAAPGGNGWLLRASADPARPEVVRIRSGGSSVKVFPFARIPASTVESISFADADNGWASVARDSKGIVDLYRTRDGGATWSLLTGAAPISGQLDFESTTRGWAGGRVIPKLASTTDGGRTWHPVDPPAPSAPLFAGVVPALVKDNVVVAYGASSTGGRPQPYVDVSTDGGRTWSLHSGPRGVTVPGGGATGIFSAGDADHWALGSANHLYVTDDGGRTWAARAQFYGVSDIQYIERPSATAMVVSALSDLPNHATVVLASTDSGATWTTVDSWAPPTPNPSVAPFPGGIVGCPTQPLTPPPPGNPPPGLVAAAERYFHPATIALVYRIGAKPAPSFASVFKFAVKSCGEAAYADTWVVEMYGPIGQGGGGSTVQRQLALAHYADGWHVFGRYH